MQNNLCSSNGILAATSAQNSSIDSLWKVLPKAFTKQQVGRVLGNKIYLGVLQWGKAYQEKCHEPIIDEEQFIRVQRLLEQTKATRKNHQKLDKYPFLLRGLVRCKCGQMMTPYHSTGRGGEPYFYYGCTDRFHRGSGSCDSPYVSAPALDRAIVTRMLVLAGDEKGRDRIAKLAIEMADQNVSRLRAEMEAVRNRIGLVQREINNLVQTVKTYGATAMEAVQEGLKASQQEQEQLKKKLAELAKQEEEHQNVSDQTRQFLEGWQHVKDVLVKADPVQQKTVIQHYISAIQWTPADKDGKEGTYVLKFFSEVVRGQDDEEDPQPAPKSEGPEPENEGPKATKPSPVLTENGLVRSVSETARQVGLEPTTSRLTAGCSTIELLPKMCRGDGGPGAGPSGGDGAEESIGSKATVK